jgi:3-oxoacyl-[acyl-carrier protein] reductase
MRLKGKTALIAGAGRNTGRALALAYAREGADLVLVSRKRIDDLKALTAECENAGARVLPLLADVSKSSEVNRLVHQGLDRFGKVDISVSVAGVRPHKLPWEFSDEEWQLVFGVNLNATFYLARALAPGMIARKSGSIIAFGGHSALTASGPKKAALAASKHGLYGLIKALAQAFGPYGVRVNMLALANIETERLNPEWYANTGTSGDPALTRAELDERFSPMKRQGTPEEVAKAAVFLASDESSYVTGDRIVCMGGMYM